MGRFRLTRNLKSYDGIPMSIEDKFNGLVGDAEGIFQALENQLNAAPQVYTRLGVNEPLPLSPKKGDILVEFTNPGYGLKIYTDGWQAVT